MPAAASICHTCGSPLDLACAEGRCAVCLFAEAFDLREEDGPLGVIGDHELIEEIARGGMGVVYRAQQREPRREVALKTMRGAELDSPSALLRFRHEAKAMADLEHAAILPVFTFGEHDGVPFFTMKLAAGGSLAQRLGDFAGKWREIATLVATVAEAVDFAHARAVLHRDLKPGNILFDEGGHAFVSDFGIAKLLDSTDGTLTRTAAVLGTPHYLAPEIAAHDARAATTASDVWSLGVILYELLAQCRPFEGEAIPALLRTITDTEPAPLRGVPRDLATITLKALAKEPRRRYLSVGALAEDLRRWLEGRAITARPVSWIERLWLWTRRKPALAGLAAVAIGTALIAAGLLWKSNRELKQSLARSLLAQATLARTQVQAGTRPEVLALLRRAVELVPSPSDEERAAWRTEAVAALALPDIREVQRITAFSEHNDGQECFSADFSRYAAAASGGGFGVWETASGKLVRAFLPPAGQDQEWKNFLAGSFRLSPDGTKVAAAFTYPDRRESLTRSYDVADGTLLEEVRGAERQPIWPAWHEPHSAPEEVTKASGHLVQSVLSGFAKGGASVVSIGAEERLIWRSVEGLSFRLTMSAQPRFLQIAPDGRHIAFSPVKGAVAIAELIPPAGRKAWTLGRGQRFASCLSASADGATLVVSTGKGLQAWDGATGKLREELPWPTGFEPRWPWFQVEPRGASVIVAPGPHPAVHRPLWQFPLTPAGRFAVPRVVADSAPWDTIHGFSSDGASWVVSGKAAAGRSANALDFALWPQGDPSRSRVVLQNVAAAGMHICTADGRLGITADQHGPDAHVWDLGTGRKVRSLGYLTPVTCIVSPNRALVAIVAAEESSIWETTGWKVLSRWKTPPGGDGFTPHFSPDGKLLAQIDREGRVSLHLTATGERWLAVTVPSEISPRECVWLSPSRLVVMGRAGELIEWNFDELATAVRAEGLPW